jgi:hypothetical protein
MYEYMFILAVLWRSSLIVFNLCSNGASKTGKPLTVWREILQTILVKSAPDLFRKKSLRCVNIISSIHSVLLYIDFQFLT